MTTPAERAVLDEVREMNRHAIDSCYFGDHARAACRAYVALAAAPPQPDLAALNAAVAEAVEAWFDKTTEAHNGHPNLDAWRDDLSNIYRAESARRAALLPKPRYEALEFGIRDHLKNITLTQNDAAALLNKEKP